MLPTFPSRPSPGSTTKLSEHERNPDPRQHEFQSLAPVTGIDDDRPSPAQDARLLTLEDAVEFIELVLGTPLIAQEKPDLVAFLRCL